MWCWVVCDGGDECLKIIQFNMLKDLNPYRYLEVVTCFYNFIQISCLPVVHLMAQYCSGHQKHSHPWRSLTQWPTTRAKQTCTHTVCSIWLVKTRYKNLIFLVLKIQVWSIFYHLKYSKIISVQTIFLCSWTNELFFWRCRTSIFN